jgi:serine phosphatase RsbU (regulator of sigma subunit)
MSRTSQQVRPQIRRAALLARFGETLAESLDFRTAARRLAEFMTVHYADMCTVDVLDDDGTIGHMAVAASDPALAAEFEQLRRRTPLNLSSDHPAARVLRRGMAELLPDMDRDMLARFAQDPDQARFVQRVGYRSVIVVPLMARGRKLGAMSLLRFDGAHAFRYHELRAVEELARQAALALDNARMHSELKRVASTLGSAFVPDRLSQPPGIEVLGLYRAAGELNEVGGDFYDVFERADSEWSLVIGDVCGKGAQAARTTALARYTLRSAAMTAAGPSQMLRTLHDVMRSQLGGHEICTACFAALRPGDGRARVTVALAGHPQPLLVRTDGCVTEVGKAGGLLGFGDEIDVADETFELNTGDTLLLYTDGVTDAGAPRNRLGEEGLESLLRDHAKTPLGVLLPMIVTEALARSSGRLRDDLALLAVRVRREVGR